jgi:hypothetical protein
MPLWGAASLVAVAAWLAAAASHASAQSVHGPYVVRVRTPEELKVAVLAGAAHIEVANHIDLRPLPDAYEAASGGSLLDPQPTLQSITARAPPPLVSALRLVAAYLSAVTCEACHCAQLGDLFVWRPAAVAS